MNKIKWTNFDEMFCVCLNGSLDDLDSKLKPAGPTRKGAQAEILIFTFFFF